MRLVRLLIVSVLAMGALVPLGLASAQYPQPLGTCILTPPATVPANAVVTFGVTTLTDKGQPAPGVTGTVTVTGDGSALTPTFITGTDGKATVQVRTGTTGAVNVKISCGALSTSSVVNIVVPAVVIPKPPVTGDGVALPTDGGFPFLWLLAGIAALTAAGAASTVAVRRNR